MLSDSQNLRNSRTYPSPTLRDYLFVEQVFADAPSADTEDMEYGMPHPDTEKFPDHVLVYISPEQSSKDGKKFNSLYYAAGRENQDSYNYTYQGFTAGKYEQYKRSYIVKRSDWEIDGGVDGLPEVERGNPDPNPHPEMPGFVLFDTRTESTGSQELDSIFILVERIYRNLVELESEVVDPESNRLHTRSTRLVPKDQAMARAINPITGYKVEVNAVNEDWSEEVETRAYDPDYVKSLQSFPTPDLNDVLISDTYNVDKLDYNSLDIGDSHPFKAGFKLVHVSRETQRPDKKREVTLYYAADRENQHIYNFKHQGHSPGGKYKQYTRTYLVPRGEFLPNIDPGSPDPNPLSGCEDYVFFGSSSGATGSKELDGLYTLVTHLYRQHVTLTGSRYDQDSAEMFDYSESVVLSSEAQSESPDDSGVYTEVIPINSDWSIVRTNKAFDSGKVFFYDDYISFYWPPVFQSLTIAPWEDDSFSIFVTYKRHAYNGYCKAKITEYFSATPPTLPNLDRPMTVLPVDYDGIAVNVRIPPCLRPTIQIDEFRKDVGFLSWSFPGTFYQDWPESLTAYARVSRYRGGFKTKIVEVFRPEA